MKNQKIINLLDKIDTDAKHFATKKTVQFKKDIASTCRQCYENTFLHSYILIIHTF